MSAKAELWKQLLSSLGKTPKPVLLRPRCLVNPRNRALHPPILIREMRDLQKPLGQLEVAMSISRSKCAPIPTIADAVVRWAVTSHLSASQRSGILLWNQAFEGEFFFSFFGKSRIHQVVQSTYEQMTYIDE